MKTNIKASIICLFSKQEWVVPENIRTHTTGGILEFRMHVGEREFFSLEFRMHGGVAGIGIPNA